nr:uncharacterized protein LOC109787525 [Aegilops tauschii subsp. strangulata]
MCEYSGDVKDPQRHTDIQLTDVEITECVKKMLDEPGDNPFWNRKPQDKPAKTPRFKTKVTKKPAKKKTTESSGLNIDDDNPESEDDAEASHASDAEGTPHSSAGESTGTQLPPLKTVPGAKARPSKKAKLNKPADDNTTTVPEKTPEPFEPNADAILNDPPPQDDDTFVEQMKTPSLVKAADDKTDDVVVTGFGYTTSGNPIALSKHSAKEEISAVDKGKWKADLESYAHLSAQISILAELSKKESQITDLQVNIKSQQGETSKAKEELTSALTAMEKLKESFKSEQAG